MPNPTISITTTPCRIVTRWQAEWIQNAVNSATGQVFKPGDVYSELPGQHIQALAEDGTILAEARCRAHPMTVTNFTDKVRRQAEGVMRQRRLLARIESDDFALPDLTPAYTGPLSVAIRSGHHEAPTGWTRYCVTTLGRLDPDGERSCWDAYLASGDEVDVWEYIDNDGRYASIADTEAEARTIMIPKYRVQGRGQVTIIRAPGAMLGTLPDGWEPADRNDPALHDQMAPWEDPLEHCCGNWAETHALDFVHDSRSRYAWVRPTMADGAGPWLCGVGIGSHTLQAPRKFPDQADATAFALLFWRADVAERAHEERDRMIGQVLDLPTRPYLIVARHTGSLWEQSATDALASPLAAKLSMPLPVSEWSPDVATEDGQPAWAALRAILNAKGWTGGQAARLVQADARTMRRWLAEPGTPSATPAPYSVFRVLYEEATK